MRRILAAAAIASLVLLATLLPATADAAPAAAYSTITGTLVATPQATVPTTLLLQVGGQTIPVSITYGTQVIDSAGNALSLSSLADGDTLQVSGTPNAAGGIDASLVQDLSQSITTPPVATSYTVTGSLDTAYSSVLCLANASVVGSALAPNLATVSPCPDGELPVYLTGSTSYEDAGGNAIALGALATGDSLQVTGTLSSNQFFASVVQDLSNQFGYATTTTSQTTTLTLVGTVQSCNFASNVKRFTVQVQQGSVRGLITIYVQNSTRIVSKVSRTVRLSTLHAGQVVTVRGMYNKHSHRLTTTTQVAIH